MNNTTVSPAEYFEQVKSRKQTMTAAGLSQLYENCLALLEEYQRSGQIAAQKKLLFHIDNHLILQIPKSNKELTHSPHVFPS